jgi:AraC-like DNA-binding protein
VLIGRLAARHGKGLPATREDATAGIVARARAFLEANAGKPVRLHDLAAMAGVSLFHLIRCFQREVGMPPHAWLTQLRANRAREMLIAGESPASVAYLCGFCDQSHLTRTFRSMLGVTPGNYARGCPDPGYNSPVRCRQSQTIPTPWLLTRRTSHQRLGHS